MRKKKSKNLFLFWVMHFVLFSVISLLLFLSVSAAWGAYSKYSFAKERASLETNKLQNLKNRKMELESDLKELSSDYGKEKILRENYSMALPEEKLIVIIDESSRMKEKKPEERESSWDIFSFFKRD